MAWKQTEKPRTVLASKSLVDEFVGMEPAPYDRPLSEKRLQVYERILRAGEFRPVTWASVICYETNCVYRVNGKHTSVLLSKMTPLPEFHVTVERYAADKLTDVANLYNTFDSNLAGRTTSDINMAFAGTVPQLRGVPVRLINLTVAAAAGLRWDENELKRVPPAEKAEELLENHDFAVWLGKLVGTSSGSPSRPLVRTAVVTAMLATYRKGPRLAADFWAAVRDETAPDRDDATRVLARFLVRAAIAGGRSGASREKKIVTHREMYAKCIHGWNAWRRGERTNLNYYQAADLPEPVK